MALTFTEADRSALSHRSSEPCQYATARALSWERGAEDRVRQRSWWQHSPESRWGKRPPAASLWAPALGGAGRYPPQDCHPTPIPVPEAPALFCALMWGCQKRTQGAPCPGYGSGPGLTRTLMVQGKSSHRVLITCSPLPEVKRPFSSLFLHPKDTTCPALPPASHAGQSKMFLLHLSKR